MTSQRSKNITSLWALALMTLLVGGDALAGPRRVRRAPPQQEVTHDKVNLNSATSEQLQLLPGIGRTKAMAIIAYRARRKFKSTFQITRVKGIGRKTFRKLRPHLTLRGETTLTEKVKVKKKVK
jgi:competence protein ComEA